MLKLRKGTYLPIVRVSLKVTRGPLCALTRREADL